jgi:anti-sigma regulatory factor (Ser/Thr protein kinase)
VSDADDLDEVIFDASRLGFCCPMDLAGVVAWASALSEDGVDVVFIAPDSGDMSRYIERMDTYHHLDLAGVAIAGAVGKSRRNDRQDSLIELSSVYDAEDAEGFANKTFALVKKRLGLHEARANHSMISELLENAVTHSDSAVGAFAAAQVYPTKRRIEVGVADAGIGIRAHLRGNPEHRGVRDDPDAIALAIQKGVTGVVEPEGSLRGQGFTNLLEVAGKHGAALVLRTGSGRGTVVARPMRDTHTHTAHTDADIPGTWALLAVGFRHPTSNVQTLVSLHK